LEFKESKSLIEKKSGDNVKKSKRKPKVNATM
jgi:hypothetical protein